MKTSLTTKDIAMAGLLMALITVMTYLVKIPVVATKGYIHLGDGFIFLSVLILGYKKGGLVAGLGSALSDFIGGYSYYVIPTLIIKFLMGFVMGLILEVGYKKIESKKSRSILKFISMIISSIVMLTGYCIAQTIMYGSFEVALAAVPMNAIQSAVGVAVGMILSSALEKTSARDRFVYK